MTQQGTIKKCSPGGRAEVEVTRRSACGHDCAKCGGCGGLETQTLYVTARNHTDAGIGDRVLIEGETGRVLGLAALVYMLPLVLFFIGYAIGNAAGGGASGALVGGVLFALGIIGAIFLQQKDEAERRSPVRDHAQALRQHRTMKAAALCGNFLP